MSIVRIADKHDAAQVSDIYAPIVKETVISFEEQPPSAKEFEERILTTLTTHPWLVAEHNGELMGYAYGSTHSSRAAYRWSANVSVYIAKAYRRRGVGRALYTSLLHLLRAQGMYNAYAGISLPNPGSQGLHESMGFTPVGVYKQVGFKFGQWVDVGWWELPLCDRSIPDNPPVRFPDMCNSAECEQAIGIGTALLLK